MNPAVTLSLAITKNISPVRALLYLLAQVGGALIGGGTLRAAIGKNQYYSGIVLSNHLNSGQGFLLEFVGTLLLLFVVFNVAVWTGKPQKHDLVENTVAALAPLPIGLAVTAAHLTLGPFTGCGINPARAIGAVVWETAARDGAVGFWKTYTGKCFWIYWIGPFVASLVAPAIYLGLFGTLQPGNAGEHHDNGDDRMGPKSLKVNPTPSTSSTTNVEPMP